MTVQDKQPWRIAILLGSQVLPEIDEKGYIMKTSVRRFVLLTGLLLLIDTNSVWADDPGDSPSTCDISVTVSTIMEWAGNFTDISLTAISGQDDTPEGSQMQTLYTNCNLEISANNDTSPATARLSSATDNLVTKYKLSYDGDGLTYTGGPGENIWMDYDTFLSPASQVTHINTDGAVDVTLYVQASNPSGRVADAGSYTAIQTLTASWTSD
jgi:hypothetical protein